MNNFSYNQEEDKSIDPVNKDIYDFIQFSLRDELMLGYEQGFDKQTRLVTSDNEVK